VTATQRPLPLALPARMGRAQFVPSGCNAAALAMLGTPLPGGRLVVHGPEGAGKTHLLQIWARARGAAMLRPAALPGADLPGLLANGAVALDDAAAVAHDPARQAALFHLLNLAGAQGAEVALAARTPVRDWALGLADLASRLQAAAHVALAPPDDALLRAVLAKLFADRQVAVPDTVIPYLLARMERSLGAAQRLVAALDSAALAQGRPITRAS